MIWLHLFMWLGHAGDMLSTHYGLQAGCHELNPFYYILGGFWGLVGLKVVSVSILSLWAQTERKPWILIAGGFLGWMAVGWNSMLLWLGVC